MLFFAQLVVIAASIVIFIPLLNFVAGLVALAGGVLNILALHSLSSKASGYAKAFQLTLVGIVIAVLQLLINGNFLGTLLSVISTIVNMLVVYLVATTTAEFLRGKDDALAGQAELIAKLYAACVAVSVLLRLITWIPFLGFLATIFNGLVSVVILVAQILYILFLSKAYKTLE